MAHGAAPLFRRLAQSIGDAIEGGTYKIGERLPTEMEFARRHGDYALSAVVTTMEHVNERAHNVRVAVMGVGDTAARLPVVEAVLEDRTIDEEVIVDAVEHLRTEIEPNSDLNASADYRRHLAGALAARGLRAAWNRAIKGEAK